MTNQEILAELAKVKAENEALRAAKSRGGSPITFRVSDKGAVSVYGMGRFPVTLYKEQWEKLLAHGEDLRKFIADNVSRLATKEPPAIEPTQPASTPPAPAAAPTPPPALNQEIDPDMPF